jgi:hypothetical protein
MNLVGYPIHLDLLKRLDIYVTVIDICYSSRAFKVIIYSVAMARVHRPLGTNVSFGRLVFRSITQTLYTELSLRGTQPQGGSPPTHKHKKTYIAPLK